MAKYIGAYPDPDDLKYSSIMEDVCEKLKTVEFNKYIPEHEKVFREVYDKYEAERKDFWSYSAHFSAKEELELCRGKQIEDLDLDLNDLDVLMPFALGACAKENGVLTQASLKVRNELQKAVNMGVDIYKVKACIAKRWRNHPAVNISEGSASLNHDKLKRYESPEEEEEYIKDLSRVDNMLESMRSPYDDLFKNLEKIEELKKKIKQSEAHGDFSQSDYFEDQIDKLQAAVEARAKDFDPEMLEKVALSKQELEIESQKFEAGIKENSEDRLFSPKTFIASSTPAYNATLALRKIAKEQQKQNAVAQQREN